SRATEAAKRSRKDWIIAATTERYSFLSYKSRLAYGLRLGYYIGKSQSLGLSLRMIQDRKFSEAEPFGEVDHKFRVQTTEMQYAYYYEFAFLRIGGGSRDASLTTRSRETGDRIYALSPTISRFASLSIGLEYQYCPISLFRRVVSGTSSRREVTEDVRFLPAPAGAKQSHKPAIFSDSNIQFY
ncbi:MAG: hypothetical protein M3Q07_17005, partial [Pseudobdellovibrionaceae bacterium]|nr:hypothetical protein [Pseudobdellovibrionaceae bacterium]